MSSPLISNLLSAVAGARADELAALFQRTEEANSALLCGNLTRYLTLIRHADDYTLMAPFGGAPTRGFDLSSSSLAELSRFFESGVGKLERVQTYASSDMVVFAMIERQHAAVGGLPDQDWSLRVTQVYRREGSEWWLVHRHADPLVRGIGLERAAALARG